MLNQNAVDSGNWQFNAPGSPDRAGATAVQSNQISFPVPVPIFPYQHRADVQWRLALLYFVHGWSPVRLAERYKISSARVRQSLRGWVRRAMTLGYLQPIPAEEPMMLPRASRTTYTSNEPIALPAYVPPYSSRRRKRPNRTFKLITIPGLKRWRGDSRVRNSETPELNVSGTLSCSGGCRRTKSAAVPYRFSDGAAGFSLEEVSSGTEATEVILHRRVDLVLLSLNLPDGRGIEKCRKLRALSPYLGIVRSGSMAHPRMKYPPSTPGRTTALRRRSVSAKSWLVSARFCGAPR